MNSIFEKETFTLKEFCKIFYQENIYPETSLNIVVQCYILFSSGNSNYLKYLDKTRTCDTTFYINNKKINIREILQIFDIDFNKTVIRINTSLKNYDITISWNQIQEKMKYITKDDILQLYETIKID